MKIMRFLAEDGVVYFGVPEDHSHKQARLISGNIFSNFSLTSESKKIVKILPPVTPPNILAVGLNYRKHADETLCSYPEIPVLFLKATSSLTAPESSIILPKAGAEEVDFEAELALVIGGKAKNVTTNDAREYILGYACAMDISARDWQKRKQNKQWARGKSFDTFCPLGPYLVTKEDIDDPNNLGIKCSVNGELFQDSNTSDMIFKVDEIVSHLSQSLTLLPGTVILTGTPEGVGFMRKPPVFLRAGDVIEVEIERVGILKNTVINEV